jgi:hypothetical protein
MQLDTTSEAIKGTVVIAGASASVMSPNEMASLAAAVLTALFVVAQFITLLPRMLDSLKELRKRFTRQDPSVEAAKDEE